MSILTAGTPVLFIDRKHRQWYAVLSPEGRTAVKGERISHVDVIGLAEGSTLRTPKGHLLDVIRAGYADHALHMARHATPIYPKDVGPILVWADIYPGARVLEVGLGSGALAMAVLRMVGPTGQLTSYEIQPSAVGRSVKNISALMGATPYTHEVVQADAYEGIAGGPYDRCVMDVPEPERVIPHLREQLRPGGGVAIYVPHIPQVQAAVKALYSTHGFTGVEVMEVLERRWVIVDEGARPDHKMQGHTGFLVFARRGGLHPDQQRAKAQAEEGAEVAEGEAEQELG